MSAGRDAFAAGTDTDSSTVSTETVSLDDVTVLDDSAVTVVSENNRPMGSHQKRHNTPTFIPFKSNVEFNFRTDWNRLGVFIACKISLRTDPHQLKFNTQGS